MCETRPEKADHQQCGKPLNLMERFKLERIGSNQRLRRSHVERALESCKEEKCTIPSFNELAVLITRSQKSQVFDLATASNHRLESRMREIRQSGSEGGEAEINRSSLPLSNLKASNLRVFRQSPLHCQRILMKKS